MAKKHRDPAAEAASGDSPAAAIRSLFSADNPFRRKASTEEAPAATPLHKQPSPVAEAAEPSSKKKKSKEEGPRPKRKRDELEAGRERRRGAGAEKPPRVGEKRKAPDDAAAGAGAGEEEEEFDDESKLLRTVFVGNLPLRTKRKVLTKEFAAFGEIESVRIRSVPLVDVSTVPLPLPSPLFRLGWEGFSFIPCRVSFLQTKLSRKGAVLQGKVNGLVDK